MDAIVLCVPLRPLGRAPAEAQSLRVSAAVAAASGCVPRGQRALLDAVMNALIDQSSCLVEPVLVLSRARAVRTEHVQRRVRSLLANVSCSRGARSLSLHVVVVNSCPLQELPCSRRSSPHVVSLQLLSESSSPATCAFSLSVVVPM